MPSPEPLANPYRPFPVRITNMWEETNDVRTLQLEFMNHDDGEAFPGFLPGQFGEFTVFGVGESVFALADSHIMNGMSLDSGPFIECTFRAVGKVTQALRNLRIGHIIGFRGPWGNAFPVTKWKGKSVVFLGGGIGMAALRFAIQTVLANRKDFNDILILNGARTTDDMVYQKEMPDWETLNDVRIVRTVDPGGESDQWDGTVGLIPQVFEELNLEPDGRIVVACGPPVMLRFLFQSLKKMNYSPQQVLTTMENKMKCGMGLCGRCNVGPLFVCRDGPVVTWEQLQSLPGDY